METDIDTGGPTEIETETDTDTYGPTEIETEANTKRNRTAREGVGWGWGVGGEGVEARGSSKSLCTSVRA